MTAVPSPSPELVAAAKRFAALSGVFDPVEALPDAVRGDPVQASLVASALAMASDTNPDESEGWLLRTAERRHVIDALHGGGTLQAAVAERRQGRLDVPTADLLDALAGSGWFSAKGLARTLVNPQTSRATIERIVTALDRAGPAAPAADGLATARMALAALVEAERAATVATRGFFGRGDEKAAIEAWFANPIVAPPARAVLLTGFPGIGKSALLDEMTRIATERYDAVVIRLDFDRAGLDVLDLRGLTMEVARQVAERIGPAAAELIEARLAAASIDPGQAGYDAATRLRLPTELAIAIGGVVTAVGRPVLMVLDTMEVLRARGDRHPGLLFDWIDALVMAGMQPLRIIAAGRGDVLDQCPDRRGAVLALDGLDRDAAGLLLDRMGVAEDARDAVLDLADGNPLVMRLAVRVAQEHGSASLPRAKLRGAVAAGFLYRFLLSRIVDPDLRRLAHPGLIARRLSADFLREVLTPQLGMKGLSEARTRALFDALAGEHWLVERDPGDPGFVRHRGDMRALLLPLLYRTMPARCAKIDAAAMRWFGQRDDDESQADAAYHSLQLMRSRPRPPLIDGDLARRLDPASIAELPEAARAVVEQAVGGRTSLFRSDGGGGAGDDQDAVKVLLHLIDAGDWAEGQHVVEEVERSRGIDPRSVAADAVRTFHWRAGRWEEAIALLGGRDRLGADDRDVVDLPPALGLARIEMRAETAGPRWRPSAEVAAIVAKAGQSSMLATRGALAFQGLAHDVTGNREWSRDGDPVAAALAVWADNGGPVADFTFGVARDRLRARGMTSSDAGWNTPQLLASLGPYPLVAVNLAVRDGGVDLNGAARSAGDRLAQAGALMGGGALSPATASAIAGIAELGLFAEWAMLAAIETRDPDLRRIARSAERWRRTVAGDWAYGATPRGWRRPGPIDATLAWRLEALAEAADPRGAALAQLAVWAPDGDGDRLWRDLGRRYATGFVEAGTIDDRVARIARLRRWLPAAYLPAAAILLGER